MTADDRLDALAVVAALPGVGAAVDDARGAVDRLRGHRVLRRGGERVASESALRGARASAALDGADVPLDVLRRTVAASGVLPAAEAPVVNGALRVAAELGALQGTWTQAPLQVLARLHALAAADLAPAAELGRPRPDSAVTGRLSALTDLLMATTAAPALVVAAVVHGELLASAAFQPVPGVVARAASRLVVVTRGLDPRALSVPEVGLVELGSVAYAQALAGYASGDADGLAVWVVHCVQAAEIGAVEGIAICEAVQRER